MNADLVTSFAAADRSGLPDVHVLSDERLQVLWTLTLGKRIDGAGRLSAPEISEILQSGFNVVVSRQKILALLEEERGAKTIARHKTRRGANRYEIMQKGIDEIIRSQSNLIFVDPYSGFEGVREVEAVFSDICGAIHICDPYVDSKTLYFLSEMPQVSQISLLTENVQNSGKLRKDLSLFNKQYGEKLEIRVAGPGLLHDRFAIHDAGILIFGNSLKDIGKKQGFVISLSKSFSGMADVFFKNAWRSAAKF